MTKLTTVMKIYVGFHQHEELNHNKYILLAGPPLLSYFFSRQYIIGVKRKAK